MGDTPVAAAMTEDTPAGAQARQKAHDYLQGFAEEFASLGVQLGARYDGSPIIVPDGAPPPDDFHGYGPSSVPGGRAPHLWLGQGRGIGDSLFDHFGAGFTVLRLGPRPPSADGIAAAFRSRGVPVTMLDVPDVLARDLYQRDLAVVRPDQHVAWRGNADPPDPERIVARMLGG